MAKIFIDDVVVVDDNETWLTVNITNNGATFSTNETNTNWTYSGTGTFLGFSTTQGATMPDEEYEVGDAFSRSETQTIYLYSVDTQVQINLTGYTWVGNSSINGDYINSGGDQHLDFNISFISNNTSYDKLYLWFKKGGTVFYRIDYEQYIDGTTTTVSVYNYGWVDDAYKTIQITGGTDATNIPYLIRTSFIAWLEANGTLTAPIQANTYNLTHTLTNLTKGNVTLQITPDTNYTYPTSLTISNGTIVSYDNTTGVAVISGDDTTIVNGECSTATRMISFTIFGTTYQAESGMTWGQWVNSAYNTDAFHIQNDTYIIKQYPYAPADVVFYKGDPVSPTDTIFENGNYVSGIPMQQL